MKQFWFSCSNINWCMITISEFSNILAILFSAYRNILADKYFQNWSVPVIVNRQNMLSGVLKREMTQMVWIETTQILVSFVSRIVLKTTKWLSVSEGQVTRDWLDLNINWNQVRAIRCRGRHHLEDGLLILLLYETLKISQGSL